MGGNQGEGGRRSRGKGGRGSQGVEKGGRKERERGGVREAVSDPGVGGSDGTGQKGKSV